jgi:6-phosphogluconate dehydrogenase
LIRYLAPLAVAIAGLALSAPALADVKEDYMAACMKASGDNTELCTCKTEQASKLVDEDMMAYIIVALADPQKFATMVNAGEVPDEVVQKWPFYVRDSNKVCLAPAS